MPSKFRVSLYEHWMQEACLSKSRQDVKGRIFEEGKIFLFIEVIKDHWIRELEYLRYLNIHKT